MWMKVEVFPSTRLPLENLNRGSDIQPRSVLVQDLPSPPFPLAVVAPSRYHRGEALLLAVKRSCWGFGLQVKS